jgi:hypothetical protein
MAYEVKVAKSKKNIVDLIKKYSEDFELKHVGISKQYALEIEKESDLYSIHVSQSKFTKEKDYNILLTINGPTKEKVKEIMEEFSDTLGIAFREAPLREKILFEILNKRQYQDLYKH